MKHDDILKVMNELENHFKEEGLEPDYESCWGSFKYYIKQERYREMRLKK